jgi:hypothetical protein
MRRRAGAVGTAGIFVVLLAASTAHAQGNRGPAILSPREGARITSSALTVRVRATAAPFSAVLNGRDVTARFRRSRGGVRSARFVRGRHFRVGEGELLVATGRRLSRRRRTASASFTALRRDSRGLRIVRRQRGARGAALHVRVHTGARMRSGRVWLNGRRVERRLRRHREGHGFTGPLGGDDGLRYGANRVIAEVEREDGTLARRARTFRVSRRLPLVAAGPRRRTRPQSVVTLDGSRTRPPRGGARVGYRWRIVAAPRGSRARLRRAGTERAHLVPDRPGRYRVALSARVTEPRTGRAAAAAAPPSATDEAEVVVAPTTSPMGVPIQTLTGSNVNGGGGIQIGSQNYAYRGGWVQLLVLDPETLQPLSGSWGAGVQSFTTNQGPQLVSAVNATTGAQLVIMSGQGNVVGANLDAGSLARAITVLGGTLDQQGATLGGAGDLRDGAWSLIGRNGLAPGQAHQNVGVVPQGVDGFVGGSGGQPGSLNGYLQPVTNNAFQFVSSEYARLDTAAPGTSETQSVVTLGGQTFTSEQIPAGALGFHLVVLNPSGALQQIDHRTYVVNNPDGSTNYGDQNSGVQGIVAALNYWTSDGNPYRRQPPVVILQAFGTPTYWGTAPNSIAWLKDTLPTFAGNRDWFGGTIPQDRASLEAMWGRGSVAGLVGAIAGPAAHDIVADYGKGFRHMGGLSVVASTHLYDQGDALVQGQTDPVQSQARVVGALTRNNQSQWTVRSPANDPQFDSASLWELAFSPPVGWPLTSGDSLANANAYIASWLFPGSGVRDVREAYVTQADADWDNKRVELREIPFPSGDDPGFNKTDFGNLIVQFQREIAYVIDVRAAIAGWQKVFGTTAFAGYVNLQTLADDIVDQALTASGQHTSSTSLDPLEVITDVLFVSQAMIGFGGPTTEWAVLPVGAVAGSLGLADALTPHHSDTVQPDTQEIWDQAYRLGQDLVDRNQAMSATLDHLGDVFVSDWGKLQAAQQASGGWDIGTAEQNALTQALSVTAKRAFVKSLSPLAYNQWAISPRFTSINQHGVPDPPRTYQCYHATDTNYDGYENPYVSDPASNLQAISYRSSSDPDPALQHTSDHTGRVLRSNQDDTKLQGTYEGSGYGNTVNMRHDGSPPPPGFINPLFQPVSDNDPPTDPVSLGMTPEEFFGSGRWTMRKLQCGGNWFP